CDLCLFSPLTVTSVSTEQFRVFGPSDPIVAAPGGEAILPCSLSPAMSVEKMELRWFRSRFSEAVFVYRDQQEQKQEQMAWYSGRTSLVKDQFHQGKAAVRIGNVQESDGGIYVCFFRQGLFYDEAVLELKVAGWLTDPCSKDVGEPVCGRKVRDHVTQLLNLFLSNVLCRAACG
ncbi:Butyrophilin subfamily 1 member A1, partial [Lemmus lemmus]